MKLAAALLALSCSNGGPGDPGIINPPNVTLALQPVVTSGLSSPVHLASPPNDARLFIVEQPGRIRIVQNGQLLATPFLDITGKVRDGGEQGLLSVAFHPQYATNRHFYVYYTDDNGDIHPAVYVRESGRPAVETLLSSHPLHDFRTSENRALLASLLSGATSGAVR